jgi:hydrogenase nickel incorporation protein HypA/HybF
LTVAATSLFNGGIVHELSVAQSLIEQACEAAAREGSAQVLKLSLRIGVLSGVVKEALLFSFELAAEDTACQGAALDIEEVPLSVHCPRCAAPQTLADGCHFICPICGTPAPQILTGRELELVSLEIATHATANC